MAQDTFEPIIGKIEALNCLSRHRPQGEKPVGHPGLDMDEAVIASGQNGKEPDEADPAQTEPIPVAVSGKMRVYQRRQLHPLQVFEEQWNVVDAFGDNILDIMPTQRLAQSPM
jgi:hypothetical protein